MPTYKLVFFDVQARAEVSRYLFALAKVEYEDKRVTSEEWPEIKKTLEQGSVPVLFVDNEQIPQSWAIARHLAREFGLYGESPMDKTRIDVIVQTVSEAFEWTVRTSFESNETKKAEMEKELKEVKLPKYFDVFTDLLKRNGNGDGFFIGDKVTLADVAVFNLFHDMVPNRGYLTEKVPSPKLAAFIERMKEIPVIAAWIVKRPKTTF